MYPPCAATGVYSFGMLLSKVSKLPALKNLKKPSLLCVNSVVGQRPSFNDLKLHLHL
jgi:hypothetical protein